MLGLATLWIGDRFLPSKPVAAVLVMEWWVLVPMAIATAASTGLILLGVKLAVPDSVKDTVVKQTSTALVSGLTAFLTAAFISAVGDKDNSAVGERIKERMRAHYQREPESGKKRICKIKPSGVAEQYLNSNFYADLSGWDRETRIRRAKGVAKAEKGDDGLELSKAWPYRSHAARTCGIGPVPQQVKPVRRTSSGGGNDYARMCGMSSVGRCATHVRQQICDGFRRSWSQTPRTKRLMSNERATNARSPYSRQTTLLLVLNS
jgi:hypothetical protein